MAATTPEQAIERDGREASGVRDRFTALPVADRGDLMKAGQCD